MKPVLKTFTEPRPNGWGFLLAGFLLAVAALYILALTPAVEKDFPRLVAGYSLLFAAYTALVVGLGKRAGRAQTVAMGCLILAFGLGERAAFWKMTPCDDIHRYAWEAKVAAAGKDPSRLPPNSAELRSLRDGNYSSINHPEIATVYPPVAQWFFRLGFIAGMTSWKILLLLCDVFAALLLWKKGGVVTALYFLNPLLAFEGVGRGHYEPIWLLLVLAAWRCWEMQKPSLGALMLSLAVLVKPQAMLLAGPWVIALGPRRGRIGAGLLLIAAATVFAAWKTGDSLRYFIAHFQYNSWLPWLLARAGGLMGDHFLLAWITPGAVGLTVIYLARQKRPPPFETWGLWLMGSLLITAKTFHPWYALWILPFACLRKSAFWIALTGTQILGLWPYWHQSHGQPWAEIPWLRFAIGIPPLLFTLALPWIQRRFPHSRPLSEPSFPPITKPWRYPRS